MPSLWDIGTGLTYYDDTTLAQAPSATDIGVLPAACAVSKSTLSAPCYVSFKAKNVGNVTVGFTNVSLSELATVANPTTMFTYSMFVQGYNENVRVIENSSSPLYNQDADPNIDDTLTIQMDGSGNVTYYQNTTLLYTSTNPQYSIVPSGVGGPLPIYVCVCIPTQDTNINNLQFGNGIAPVTTTTTTAATTTTTTQGGGDPKDPNTTTTAAPTTTTTTNGSTTTTTQFIDPKSTTTTSTTTTTTTTTTTAAPTTTTTTAQINDPKATTTTTTATPTTTTTTTYHWGFTVYLLDLINSAADPSATILEMLTTQPPDGSASNIVTAITYWLITNLNNPPAGFNPGPIYAALAAKYTIVSLSGSIYSAPGGNTSDIRMINLLIGNPTATTYGTISFAFTNCRPSLTDHTIYLLANGTYSIQGSSSFTINNNALTPSLSSITISGRSYSTAKSSPFILKFVTVQTYATIFSSTPTASLIPTIASPQAAINMLSSIAVGGGVVTPLPSNLLTAALNFTSSADKSLSKRNATSPVYKSLSDNFPNQTVKLTSADSATLVAALKANPTEYTDPTLSTSAQVTVVIPSFNVGSGTGNIPDVSTTGVTYMVVQNTVSGVYTIGSAISTLVVNGSTGQQLIRTPNKPDQPMTIGSTVKIYRTATTFYNYRVYFLGSSVIGSNGLLYDDTAPYPCFLRNAPVLTPSGYRPISSLKVGDLVQTDTGAHVAIQRVSVTTVSASPASNPYRIPKGRFGATKALAISPNHKVQVDGKMIEARHLDLEVQEMFGTFDYYNLELPDYENMIVAGVTVESLYPLTRITMTGSEFYQALCKTYGAITPAAFAAAIKKVRRLANGTFVVPIDKRIYNKK